MKVNFNQPNFVKPRVAKIAKKVAKGALITALVVGGADVAMRTIASLDAGITTGNPSVDNAIAYRDKEIMQGPPLVVQLYDEIEDDINDRIETRNKLKEYGMNPNQYIGKRVEAKEAIDSAESMQYCLEHGVKPISNEDAHYLSDSLRAEAVGITPYGRNDNSLHQAATKLSISLAESHKNDQEFLESMKKILGEDADKLYNETQKMQGEYPNS